MNEAMRRMVSVRVKLILENPFWGSLAMRLKLVEDPTCDTAWVDGHTLGFDPEFTQEIQYAEAVGLMAHEVGHCALRHPWRRGGRDNDRWNEACDRALNPMLRDAGFRLPEGALFELDPTHKGKSAEWIYNRLLTEQPAGGDGNDSGSGNEPGSSAPPSDGKSGEQPEQGPGDDIAAEEEMESKHFDKDVLAGEVRDAPPDTAEGNEEAANSEEDWTIAVKQAAHLAAGQGKLPAGVARVVERATESKVDWKAVTRRFIQEITPSDFSWNRPNPRYIGRGLYLPALSSRELGPLVLGIDTSGSIDNPLLKLFGSEVQAIFEELNPRRLHVMYCDASLKHEDVFERGDQIKLEPHGGGGTKFTPVFEAAEKLDEPPVAVIYLTDLKGTFPPKGTDFPTLWITPTRYDANVPFGEVVLLEE